MVCAVSKILVNLSLDSSDKFNPAMLCCCVCMCDVIGLLSVSFFCSSLAAVTSSPLPSPVHFMSSGPLSLAPSPEKKKILSASVDRRSSIPRVGRRHPTRCRGVVLPPGPINCVSSPVGTNSERDVSVREARCTPKQFGKERLGFFWGVLFVCQSCGEVRVCSALC